MTLRCRIRSRGLRHVEQLAKRGFYVPLRFGFLFYFSCNSCSHQCLINQSAVCVFSCCWFVCCCILQCSALTLGTAAQQVRCRLVRKNECFLIWFTLEVSSFTAAFCGAYFKCNIHSGIWSDRDTYRAVSVVGRSTEGCRVWWLVSLWSRSQLVCHHGCCR